MIFPLDSLKPTGFNDGDLILQKQIEENTIQITYGKKPEPIALLEITPIKKNKEEMFNYASRMITSFRLVREGGIGYSKWCDEGQNYKDAGEHALPYCPLEGIHKIYEIKQELKDELEMEGNVLDFYKKLSNIFKKEGNDSILTFALSRFNRSYFELNREDVLLDLVICLEVLSVLDKCVFCSKRPDKWKDLPEHIAEFIKNEEEIKDVKKYLLVANGLRNGIVHQGQRIDQKKLDKEGLGNKNDFLLKIRKYVRIALGNYIKQLDSNPDLKAIDIKLSMYRKEFDIAYKRIQDIQQGKDPFAKKSP